MISGRKTIIAIVVLLGIYCPTVGTAKTYLLQGSFTNATAPPHLPNEPIGPMDPNPLSFASGGNIPIEEATDGSAIIFTIGYPFTATAAMVNASNVLKEAAMQQIKDGAKYRYVLNQTGIGDGAWNICFFGVRDQITGRLCDTDKYNFSEDNTLEAERLYRAALSVNPFDTVASEGLLNSFYERMVPRTFAGNNELVYATTCRFQGKDLSEEIDSLERAFALYNNAAMVFITATGTLPDIDYINGTSPYVDQSILRRADSENLGVVPTLIDAYIRALALRAEAIVKIITKSYLRDYSLPVLPIENSPKRQELIARIEEEVTYLSQQLLLASAFSDVTIYQESDMARANNAVSRLIAMQTTIRDGDLFFTISRGSDGNVSGESFGVFPHEYVPFIFDPYQFQQYSNSFDLLHQSAEKTVSLATERESQANYAAREYDNNIDELEHRFENIRATYYSELTTICGQRIHDNNQIHPDVVFALLPPGEREKYDDDQYSGPGESKGTIYQQWLKIRQAEIAYDSAMMELENLYAKLQKHIDTANAIADTINNLAEIHLTSGEEIAVQDLLAGDLQAQRIKYAARKERQKFWGQSILGVAGGTLIGFATGGPGGAAAGAAVAVSAVAGAYVNFSATGDLAKKDVYVTKQLAAIEAQKARIHALEAAKVEFQRRDELLLRTEEMVFGMMLDAERQKLNILMAQQTLDMETAELANLMGRVAFLLQEYGRAINATAHTTLVRPDFRLVRDMGVREADEIFLFAQERSYLAAKAAEYHVNSIAGVEDVGKRIEYILRARNARDLQVILDALGNDIQALYMSQGTPVGVSRKTISVRHFLVQNNYVKKDSEGNVIWDDPENMIEEYRDKDGNVITSDQNWKEFLQQSLVYDPLLGANKLIITFYTSLNRANRPNPINPSSDPLAGKERHNPLFEANFIGMHIVWASDFSHGRRGVLVDIRGRGLEITPDDDIRIDLRQEGSSYVRFRKWREDPNGTGIRIWNLQPVLGRVTPSINGVVHQVDQSGHYTPNCPQFHERSPANDRWTLTIEPTGDANTQLLAQLDNISDIVITFTVTGFTPNK